MKIAIASDHAGFELKEKIIEFLKNKNKAKADKNQNIESENIKIIDFGCKNSESCDYPDFAFPASKAVADKECEKGILICGSGTGMSIVANKVKSIRAANCLNIEMAELAVKHNNINMLCLGSRMISEETAFKMIDIFLFSAKFENGRHQQRIEKIHNMTKV
jgi:ribose 5-phosphate isomerase B